MMTPPLMIVDAHLSDPASGYDGPGALLIENGLIARIYQGETHPIGAPDTQVLDAGGKALIPGLIDGRVRTGEPGSEPRETLKSAGLAAAAGGVTSLVLLPDTDPVIDEPAMIDFIKRRGRDHAKVRVYPTGAATRGLEGRLMAELGLMREAGALYFSDADHVIVDSKVFKRVLTYAGGFNALVAHRPKDAWLSEGAVATDGEMAARMGLPGVAALAERIGLERDLALVELTGARFLVDQISTAEALRVVQNAKTKGLDASVSVSINHLCFNELDIGDYRTFFRLDPPLRAEHDRQALLAGLADGLIDMVVSNHAPAPAEDKRLPFSEAAPGALGLQTLLPALLNLRFETDMDLIDLLRPVTSGPAELFGLEAGQIAEGFPADLVLIDLDAPFILRERDIVSKSKNSPFENRTLQGRVLFTWVGGQQVYSDQ